jgi:hypothetical protein
MDALGGFPRSDVAHLSPLKKLRTVRAHADKLLVLQARHGDMTLLDYSRPGEPQVSIVDFDRNGDLQQRFPWIGLGRKLLPPAEFSVAINADGNLTLR